MLWIPITRPRSSSGTCSCSTVMDVIRYMELTTAKLNMASMAR